MFFLLLTVVNVTHSCETNANLVSVEEKFFKTFCHKQRTVHLQTDANSEMLRLRSTTQPNTRVATDAVLTL
jgi:hypothetical protein